MKAKGLGVLSALTASICCLGPLVLIVMGLGGLGLGAILGKYHWYFIVAAALLLTFAWIRYFTEKKSCATGHCEMVPPPDVGPSGQSDEVGPASGGTLGGGMGGKKMTGIILLLASVMVLTFASLNIYTYAKGKPAENLSQSGIQISIPVKGMSCFTCEIAIQQAVKKLPGIGSVKASARDGIARVSYDPEKTSLDEIVTAINETGYKAEKQKL